MRILHVVGARPNFMKAAPVIRALRDSTSVSQMLVHTGQHYDVNMSETFFQQLDLPKPSTNLGVGSGSHAQQTAQVMVGLEQVLLSDPQDLVVVYGDVNSTLAASLVASKLGIALAHVEAGLRSGDRSMPEEINRLVTDRLANILFTPSADAVENLLREGVERNAIHDVGNVMIDTLVTLLDRADSTRVRSQLGIDPAIDLILVTLHRPSNVDDERRLAEITAVLRDLTRRAAVVFSVHPRTRARLASSKIDTGTILLCAPLSYVEFLGLQRSARLVITDSGGIQEETTFLGVQCLTVRDSTERPITVTLGTNQLVGLDPAELRRMALRNLDGHLKQGVVPPLWDGRAAARVAQVLRSIAS